MNVAFKTIKTLELSEIINLDCDRFCDGDVDLYTYSADVDDYNLFVDSYSVLTNDEIVDEFSHALFVAQQQVTI